MGAACARLARVSFWFPHGISFSTAPGGTFWIARDDFAFFHALKAPRTDRNSDRKKEEEQLATWPSRSYVLHEGFSNWVVSVWRNFCVLHEGCSNWVVSDPFWGGLKGTAKGSASDALPDFLRSTCITGWKVVTTNRELSGSSPPSCNSLHKTTPGFALAPKRFRPWMLT